MVYVINNNGQPLMPTERHGKVRRLLKDGKAIVYKKCPFTIKLCYDAQDEKQEIVLGVDAGTRHVGLSACTDGKELYAEELELRSDVTLLLSERNELRRNRRYRKTRYRKEKILNRVRKEKKGLLKPSIDVRIKEHITRIKTICKILPVSKIIVEVAEFDIQKLNAFLNNEKIPIGEDYQSGELSNFNNIRQYILARDGYTCRYCKKKSTDKNKVKLHVHHIETRKNGGESPSNLITLCSQCHKLLHFGEITISAKRNRPLKDATFMNVMRRKLIQTIQKEVCIPIEETYGYITKTIREKYGIQKSHVADARCITGFATSIPLQYYYRSKALRSHNRKIHKGLFKNGRRKRNQCEHEIFGFRRWDKVSYNGNTCFIRGRRADGRFSLVNIFGDEIGNKISYKKIKFLETASHYIIDKVVICDA